MWHRLLVPFLAVGSLLHPHHQSDPYTHMVEKVEKSVVRITGEMTRETMFGTQQGTYTCTGEVIAVDRVLTAAHCIGQKMKTDQDEVQVVIKADKTLDLALLATNTHQKPSMKFRQAPVVRFEVLTAIGYAYGYTELSVLLERVFFVHSYPWGPEEDGTQTPAGIIVQGGYIGGMSGGPVVDAKGLQVSIVQRGGEFVGYGVDVAAIQGFLAGVQ